MIEFSKCKNLTAIKNKVRNDLTEQFKNFLIKEYGEENVSQIGVNEIAVAVGEIKDEDNFTQEVCAVVKCVAKSWKDSEGEIRKNEAFDRYQAAEDYQMELESKKKKKKKN